MTDCLQYLFKVFVPKIALKDTRLRKAITPVERLCLTLHFHASGGSLQSLFFPYCIGTSTIRGIIQATCVDIWDILSENLSLTSQ